MGCWCMGCWCTGCWCTGCWCTGCWCMGCWCMGCWCIVRDARRIDRDMHLACVCACVTHTSASSAFLINSLSSYFCMYIIHTHTWTRMHSMHSHTLGPAYTLCTLTPACTLCTLCTLSHVHTGYFTHLKSGHLRHRSRLHGGLHSLLKHACIQGIG
jgi:hypothetical protein